jgi:phosphohistidine phosphatase SixA
MTLYLVQNGEARPGNEDSERPLTEIGAATASRMADWAAGAEIKVDRSDTTESSVPNRLQPFSRTVHPSP